MARHLIDVDGCVHSEGADGYDTTLCCAALEGENGDTPMKETFAGIDCNMCIAIINFCKRVRPSEIKAPFQRRATSK